MTKLKKCKGRKRYNLNLQSTQVCVFVDEILERASEEKQIT
jgi:hypothetical protein